MLEVRWPVQSVSRALPSDTGYAVFGSLCRAGLIVHAEPETIVLPLGRELVIRCADTRAWRLAATKLHGIEVGGASVVLGRPTVRPLQPSDRLTARLVVIKGAVCDQTFRQSAARQLAILGLSQARFEVGPRRVIRVDERTIVGYGARVSGLSVDDSLTLQAHGLGGKLRMGCGGFVAC